MSDGVAAMEKLEKVVVFGGGSFGTAMGVALARKRADLQVRGRVASVFRAGWGDVIGAAMGVSLARKQTDLQARDHSTSVLRTGWAVVMGCVGQPAWRRVQRMVGLLWAGALAASAAGCSMCVS